MAKYQVKYTEVYTGYYYVDAESEDDAVQKFNRQMYNEEVDFDRLELTNSDIVVVSSTDHQLQ